MHLNNSRRDRRDHDFRHVPRCHFQICSRFYESIQQVPFSNRIRERAVLLSISTNFFHIKICNNKKIVIRTRDSEFQISWHLKRRSQLLQNECNAFSYKTSVAYHSNRILDGFIIPVPPKTLFCIDEILNISNKSS